jgi:hypothetical protein
MQPLLAPQTAESTRTSEYDYRVLFLSGTWQTPIGSEFRLRATLYVQKDGSIDGCMYWRAVRIRGVPQCYFGTEAVRGFVRGARSSCADTRPTTRGWPWMSMSFT